MYTCQWLIAQEYKSPWKLFKVRLCCGMQGFELNPEEWLKYNNVKECAVLDKWEAELGMLQPSEA